MDYRDRTPILVLFGVVLLLVGVAVAFIGPLEIYCFYLFSEGGRFHYEGFGIGSFMFANIGSQILGYYLIAALTIPLGYGHVRRLRWARTLSLTLLGFWLVSGIPLLVAFLFILVTSKGVTIFTGSLVVVLLALSYTVIPILLIRFYRSRDVRLTFERHDPGSYWIERIPLPVLVVCSLLFFAIVVLHILILFNSVFPFFHTLLFDFQGLLLIDLSVMALVGLIWGTLRLRPWAWWGSVLYWSLLTFSSIAALSRSSLADILSGMKFAPLEMEALGGMPLHGVHFALLAGIPLLVTWGLIVYSRRYFSQGGEQTN